MESKILQKYSKYTVSQLLKQATLHFNLYIRLRDTDENGYGKCISSGRTIKIPDRNSHAGHYIAHGSCSALRYNEDNVHLQSLSDNYFKSGNQLEYRKNLKRKIGAEKLEELENALSIKKPFRWDRFTLIDLVETYKAKSKALKKTKNFKI